MADDMKERSDATRYFFKMLALVLLIVFLLWADTGFAQDVKTYIPERGKLLVPTMLAEQNKYFKEAVEPAYLPALAEHESCISLKHKNCMNPEAELLTKREHGAGLFQITMAWKKDGSVRFDSLEAMKTRYKNELKELSWSNVKTRPDLQTRLAVLMVKDTYQRYAAIKDPYVRYHFTDNDYNGGGKDVQRARIACNLAIGCNSQLWFDHTEKYNPKSAVIMPGYGRSPKQISLHHTEDVFHNRLPKYQAYIKSLLEKPL